MSVSALLGNPKPQFFISGLPAVGYRLFFYAAATSTKQDTYTDSTAGVVNSNPLTLDAEGYPTGNVMIYGTNSLGYKIVMAPPGTDDPPTSPTWTIDNIYPGSIVDGEWYNPISANYLTTSTFTVAGDYVSLFYPNTKSGKRLYLRDTDNSTNDRWSIVVNASYASPNTTITVENVVTSTGTTSSLNANMDTVYVSVFDSDATSGNSNYYQILPNETPTNLYNLDYEWGNVLRYIPRIYHESIRNGSIATDLDTYIQNCIDENNDTYFPKGTFPVGNTLTIVSTAAKNLIGEGKFVTSLQGSTNMTLKTPIIQYTNGAYSKIRGMEIKNNSGIQLSSAIEMRVSAPITITPQGMMFEDLYINGVITGGYEEGILYIADAGQDNNNERGFFKNCDFSMCAIGIQFYNHNSVVHSIIGGVIGSCGIGISTYVSTDATMGGSFGAMGTVFIQNGLDIDIGNSQTHHINLVNCFSEGGTGYWIRCLNTERNNINATNCTFRGGIGSDGILYDGYGTVKLIGCDIIITAGGGSNDWFKFSDARSNLLIQNCSLDVGTIDWAGNLTMIANQVTTNFTRGANARLTKIGDQENYIFAGSRETTEISPVITNQDITYAASLTPNADLGNIMRITLTGNITINAPTGYIQNASTNFFQSGFLIVYDILQDGTGGHTVTFSGSYKQGWSDTGNTANKRSTIMFYYDSTTPQWIQIGAQSPYM